MHTEHSINPAPMPANAQLSASTRFTTRNDLAKMAEEMTFAFSAVKCDLTRDYGCTDAATHWELTLSLRRLD